MSQLYDLTFARLEAELSGAGLAAVHAKEVWRGLYRDAEPTFAPGVQTWLGAGWNELPAQVVRTITSSDGQTRKLLVRLADGAEIETVLMGYPGRFTVCVSTQSGCAMGCVFCATGQQGFTRHLRPGEIVAQVLLAQRCLAEAGQDGLRNMVLMGMGEPLHNYDAVMTALDILTDTRGLGMAARKITISTVGVIPGILRLAAEKRIYNLAVSLHAAADEVRTALVPVNRRWPLADLMAACREYGRATGQRIFFEWTLIHGKNDAAKDAHQLLELIAGLHAHVNLIPLNPTQAYEGNASAQRAVHDFQRLIQEAEFPCTVRQRRGIDVAAGCGQLAGGVD